MSLEIAVVDTDNISRSPIYANITKQLYNAAQTTAGYGFASSSASMLVMDAPNQNSTDAATRGFVNFEITNDVDGGSSAIYHFLSVFRRYWGDSTSKHKGFGQIIKQTYELNKLVIKASAFADKFFIKGKIKYF